MVLKRQEVWQPLMEIGSTSLVLLQRQVRKVNQVTALTRLGNVIWLLWAQVFLYVDRLVRVALHIVNISEAILVSFFGVLLAIFILFISLFAGDMYNLQ